MVKEERSRDRASLGESGGASSRAKRRRGVDTARGTTRKVVAGYIATREIAGHVTTSSRFYLFILPKFVKRALKSYLGVVYRCVECMMGMMGVIKWLRKDIVQRDRNRRSLTPKLNGLNNEAYRNALQAFIDRRRNPSDSCLLPTSSPDKERLDFFINKNNEKEKKKKNEKKERIGIPGTPHVEASEIFEIGWVAGTEDRYMELIFAEWQTTRVALRRHTHPDCRNAIRADLEVLTEIRHSNVLLLMATTNTDDHGLVALFEPINCTLYNFVHEQGERVSIQSVAKCAGNLAGALMHAHMRGYVHGAISSHCVFLATCGTVKLGGWELARSTHSGAPKVTREYEERLRLEIFRWQAPELFKGKEPTKATDVYGLTLLMWEMCTMNVPWSGLTKSEIERQYLQWERGVITDLYNFPPLLNNLLDAGLQLDDSKRTLDMPRMRRFLQTLEIQYEDEPPLYVEPVGNIININNINNNNNDNHNHNNKLMMNPSSARDNFPPLKKFIPATLQTPRRGAETKKTEANPPRLLNLNVIDDSDKSSEKRDLLSFSRNDTAPVETIHKIVNPPLNPPREKVKNVKRAPCNEDSSHKPMRHSNPTESQGKLPDGVKIRSERGNFDSSDEEEPREDPRVNIKKLRQALASKRENFFYGNDSFELPVVEENSEKMKNRLIMQVKSKDYEPHKPASHKTSFEPKSNKSPDQYNKSSSTRLAIHQSQKTAYSYVPSAVRDAVAQRKVLNSDSQSFFESSLWRKEKMICLSKMRKNNINDSTFFISRFRPTPDDNNDSVASNNTYTIEAKDNPSVADSIPIDVFSDISASTIHRTKSLQALKDALERATEIARTNSIVDTSTLVSSPSKSPECFENTSHANESIFENLYGLNRDEPDSEIKSIERSMNGEQFFSAIDDKQNSDNEKDADEAEEEKSIKRRLPAREETKKSQLEPARLSNVVCESIAESLNENDTSSGPDDRTVILSRSEVQPQIVLPPRKATFDLGNEDDNEKSEDPENSFALMVFYDKNKACFSCNTKGNLARRRSLPAALGQLRNLSNASLGKLPIRKGDLPDNTVEDIYIDDEFGDQLNVNMVLLDGEAPSDDEDFLPDLLEMSHSQEYA